MSRQMAAGLRPPPSGIKNSREAGVCFIQGSPPGTGVLVSWRGQTCILTNQHVINDEEIARGSFALFGYDDHGNKDAAWRCPLLPELLLPLMRQLVKVRSLSHFYHTCNNR